MTTTLRPSMPDSALVRSTAASRSVHTPPGAGATRRINPMNAPRGDGLTPMQQRSVIAAIVVLHLAGGWALLQVAAVREAVLQAAPIFVELISPPTPPTPPTPVVPPPPVPQPMLKKPPPPAPLIAAAPSPVPSSFVVPPAPAAVVAAPAPVAPSPAPAPAPKIIPASSVQYLEPPVLVYPRLSERNGERGRVMVRVYIDTAGLPQNVQVSVSSGYSRLDEAAVSAVRKARFKPYTENGLPTAGWAVVPANFE